MIEAEWFHRLVQSLEYAAGFELFLLLGPGSLAESTLADLASELARFGAPRWHALDREGLDGLLGARETKVVHFVHGLENLPLAAARGLVARLNVNRGQLREVGAPVLVWVPETFYDEFLRQAPDLVAWRSQTAVIVPRDLPPELDVGELERTPDPPRSRSGAELAIGDVVAQRYVLTEKIGRGGFASVWKAFDRTNGQSVAVKFLRAQWVDDDDRVARFESGARTMAALVHASIARVLDSGHDGSIHFLVMPWYAGGDLDHAIRKHAIESRVGLSACADAIEGLDHAHRQGMLHCDVKPSNILLDDRGRGYIADFDLVQAVIRTMGTRTGAMGTFVYSAPEQLDHAKSVDVRADVYGAAMCLLFVLLGKSPPPLVASTEPSLIDQLPCSPALRDAIRGAVAYDREQRTTTCPQLVTAVREFIATEATQGPAWAALEGVDEHGRWARIQIGGVEQRLRWIPPGTFMMGSPESELGRFDHEGPYHRVTLTRGLWMADTLCTQALWVAVMGENPSHFNSPQRPVEQVSWNDVQAFLEALAARLPGPRPSLASEAEWEYACRSHTTGPRYGPVDEVAWHWGNSGGTTHEVGQKRPNSWGLFDMLGNVWEWCADGPRMYDGAEVVDPYANASTRVCRGGSWGSDARFARAACRVDYPPSYRYGSVGFRLAWHVGP